MTTSQYPEGVTQSGIAGIPFSEYIEAVILQGIADETIVLPGGADGAVGPQGATGPAGAQGPSGTNGADGAEGPTGPAGEQGAKGDDGEAGPTGPTGATGPAGPQGPEGAPGVDGRSVLNGLIDPTNSIGNNGDFYINTVALTLWGPKAAGAWPSTGIDLGGDITGEEISNKLDVYFGNETWRLTAPKSWVMTIGKTGTTYGFRKENFGAFANPTIYSDREVDVLMGISPSTLRFRLDNYFGEDDQVPSVSTIGVKFRDLVGSTATAYLVWDSEAKHYQSTEASTAYDWLATRDGYTVTVTGLNSQFETSTLTIQGFIPTAMTVGAIYSQTLAASGGLAPYTYSLQGTWPAGLSISSSTGVVSGSPTTPGSYTSLYVRVTDAAGVTADIPTFTITVSAATSLSITGTPVTTATQGTFYTGFTAVASGGQTPYTYSLQGTWPTGISINASTGQVSGTPTNSGSFTSLSVRVTDADAATDDMDTFTLTVSAESDFGELVAYAGSSSTNPTMPTHAIGDWLITVGARVSSHSGVAPSVTIDGTNPWVLWGSLTEGADRSIAVYKMEATRTDHTVTWANVGGTRAVWVYRGKEPDVLKLATYANGTSIVIPEL